MRVVFVGVALAALASVTVVRAADLPSPPPPPNFEAPAPVASWEGFYAGSVYGFGLGDFRSSQTASKSVSKSGQTGGGLVGYNFQSGRFVYGLEGDITLNVLRGANPGVSPGLISANVDDLYTSRLRGRLGYDFGQFLPFVAGGVAYGEVYQSNGPLYQFGQTRRETGLTLGAGLDYRFMAPFFGPVIVRGEYVYDDFPEKTFGLLGGNVRTQIAANYVRIALIVQPGDTWRPSPSQSDKAPPVDWSGAYGGLLGGGIWTQSHTAFGGASTNVGASGPMFGLFTGRNFMFNSWMLGYEGSTQMTNATGRGPQPLAPVTTYRNYIEADLRGRLGYAIGRFLPFVAAGADWGRSEQIDVGTGSERGRIPSESLTAGAGLEYMVDDRWSTRIEYLYDKSFSNADTRLDGLAYSQARQAQEVRLGVAYHFH